jgi:hypothetical protein
MRVVPTCHPSEPTTMSPHLFTNHPSGKKSKGFECTSSSHINTGGLLLVTLPNHPSIRGYAILRISIFPSLQLLSIHFSKAIGYTVAPFTDFANYATVIVPRTRSQCSPCPRSYASSIIKFHIDDADTPVPSFAQRSKPNNNKYYIYAPERTISRAGDPN